MADLPTEQPDEMPEPVKQAFVQLGQEAYRELSSPLSGPLGSYLLEERLETFFNQSLPQEERERAGIRMVGSELATLLRAQSQGKDLTVEMKAWFERMQEAMKRVTNEKISPDQEPPQQG